MSKPRSAAPSAPSAPIWKQPLAVWAIAFACVVAFMGIGLVDPILPAIAEQLHATPFQSELLFTSYLAVTGLAMLVTSFVSSRIGTKASLLIGLALVVVFAFLCAISGSVDEVIGFRAGWGLGNALFISTALAAIVGAASGGSGQAIVLYEAALGIGIAVGPLVGGLLGEVSWRGPFFGVAALMAIAFIAILTLLRTPHEKRSPIKLSAPITALGRPALGTLAVTALFYNVAFFILLAYSPFPLGFGAMGIGYTFFGWGIALAITSVWLAPIMIRAWGRRVTLMVALPLLAVDLVVAGVLVETPAALVTCIIVGGLFLGVCNTTLTEAVMEATDLPRQVASSSYSAVRFLGGAAAPPLAAWLGAQFSDTVPYVFAAGAAVVATLVLAFAKRPLAVIDAHDADAAEEAEAALLGDAA
ncbi:MFS transporter [Microbacterium halophytorum]|uniref:MFS transporter n=1 Tax=Microbacterium halophytorum TaxID=2067568 RepID=UPI001E58A317|nr:MFS transporter [Microbacterium halophytorum]